MGVIRGVVFDLDDTLFFERDYVLSGFRSVALAIANDSSHAEYIFGILSNHFNSGIRGDVFDRMLAEAPLLGQHWRVSQLVELYRTHRPMIELHSEAAGLIAKLVEDSVRLAIITDGPVSSQSAKIEALGLARFFDPMILTDSWGIEYRKPHPRAFESVMRIWELSPEQLIYIGDNPDKDFFAPRALGWETARVRLTGQLRSGLEARSPEFSPAREFGTFANLAAWLHTECRLMPAQNEESTR